MLGAGGWDPTLQTYSLGLGVPLLQGGLLCGVTRSCMQKCRTPKSIRISDKQQITIFVEICSMSHLGHTYRKKVCYPFQIQSFLGTLCFT